MNFFEEAALRLKQQLKVTEDKQAAEALGMTGNAWTMRKRRGTFPEKELYALAAKQPGLNLDVNYVLTGITATARAALDAKQARIERAVDAGLDVAQIRATEAAATGPTAVRLAELSGMLCELRAAEFDGVFTLVHAIASARKVRGGSK